MKQTEIWDVNFNPVKGSEQAGIRPAVIVSGDIMNDNYNVVIVCPISSNIKNHRGNIQLRPNKKNGLKTKSEILTFHIKSVSKNRLIYRRGVIENSDLELLKENLNKILTY